MSSDLAQLSCTFDLVLLAIRFAVSHRSSTCQRSVLVPANAPASCFQGGTLSRLIVYVPGLGEDPDVIDGLYKRLQADPAFGPKEDTYLFKYPDGVHLFSRGPMVEHCDELAWRI